MVEAVRAFVAALEGRALRARRVGVGTPGSIPAATGCIKNANSAQLNGRLFAGDLARHQARFEAGLASALASVVNMLDSDVIVLGGGLSNIASTTTPSPSCCRRAGLGSPRDGRRPQPAAIRRGCAARLVLGAVSY